MLLSLFPDVTRLSGLRLVPDTPYFRCRHLHICPQRISWWLGHKNKISFLVHMHHGWTWSIRLIGLSLFGYPQHSDVSKKIARYKYKFKSSHDRIINMIPNANHKPDLDILYTIYLNNCTVESMNNATATRHKRPWGVCFHGYVLAILESLMLQSWIRLGLSHHILAFSYLAAGYRLLLQSLYYEWVITTSSKKKT